MDKSKFIAEKIDQLVQFWYGWAAFFGALFFIVLSLMDYVATPENFQDFIYYRLLGAAILAFTYLLNRKLLNRRYQLFLVYAGTILPLSVIEYMILHFGGHASTYYAGFFIFVMVAVGFIPINLRHALAVTLIAFSIYIVPILVLDESLNLRYFSMPLSFLLATFSIAVVWRHLSQQRLISELGLQFDLEQQKKQLEAYSSQLQSMVEERTKELHESEQWHRSLFENATDGIIVMNRKGIIVNANDKACEMHGFTREALVGTHIKLLSGSGDWDKGSERLNRILNGESLVFEATNSKKDGTSISFEISSKAISIGNELFIQSFYRDITEKQKFQQHLLQSQKMESIGVLAGGIAHDFNNILTAILGHTDLIRRFSVLDEKAARSLNVIEDASRRAGRMISKLLGFARKSKYERTPINLNDVVYETIKLLEQVIDKSINLSVELDNRLPLIQGDVNQMEQVIMNFIVNARDAMPKTGGRIVIRTQSRTVVKGMTDVPPYVPPGEYVQISVSDTGTGIPEEIVHKIFEPFFTTKEQGKGTGLGLSMVYGAIKDHEGYLSVQSTLGAGSVFTVYLPAAARTAVAGPKAVSLKQAGGKETLLVVDDEQDILDIMQASLESQGYKVFATSDSNVAMDLYRRIFHEVALVISDIAMPGIDGKELIRQIKGVNPDVKILAVSGYSRYVAGNEEIKEIDGFLQKPFESYYLLSVVRRILDTKSKKFIPA
jgi:two-component system, cell cycle sensor histidine kinase and response regulator CckA